MHPLAFKVSRKYPRYHIKDLPELKGGIGGLLSSMRVTTMGAGGCAFVSRSRRILYPPMQIECVFEMKGVSSPVSVRADLLYSFVNSKTAEEASFFGVEFIAEDRPLVAAIVRKLEELSESEPNRVALDVMKPQ